MHISVCVIPRPLYGYMGYGLAYPALTVRYFGFRISSLETVSFGVIIISNDIFALYSVDYLEYLQSYKQAV
ncbi:hypothetical protein KL86SPO_31222 [uncultured Sporomusa sp.]|uniref:Uncharacterized protein n=1 Tax=uncultured Sporomusa sp. TaxID=307249 RepID=A0A212LU34_9FIRM|nr:hypothetical protein KL86SPO_31222 [uncultured Sporomusa sp.]